MARQMEATFETEKNSEQVLWWLHTLANSKKLKRVYIKDRTREALEKFREKMQGGKKISRVNQTQKAVSHPI